MRTALYPGTFDPVTNGHLDLMERGARCFDRLIIGVARASTKNTMFSLDERLELLKTQVAHLDNAEVVQFKGLTVDFAQASEAGFLIRGLRAFSDFEFEFQMALMNRKLAPEVETLFLMPQEELSYISSSRVKEIARLGGDISLFVPDAVAEALRAKVGR